MSTKIVQGEFSLEVQSKPKLSEEETNRAMIRGLFARDGKKAASIDSLKQMQEEIMAVLGVVDENETDMCLVMGNIFRRQNEISDTIFRLMKKLDEMPEMSLKKCP